MKSTLLDLVTSKKFLTALTAVIVYLAGRFGFDVDTATLDRVYLALLAFVGAQGIADSGKEAAKIYAVAGLAGPAAGRAASPDVAAASIAERGSQAPLLRVAADPLGTTPTNKDGGGAATPSATSTITTLGIVACVALAAAGLAPACASVGPEVKKLAKDVIDCTSADRKAVIAQFEPTLEQLLINATSADGKEVDWAPIKAASKTFAVDLGGCALASAVAALLNPPPAKPDAPASAALVVDPAALRAGFEALRAEQFGGVGFHTQKGDV